MKQIKYLGKEITSGWRNVTAQERINCYLEVTPQGEKQKVVAYGTPGLTTFCDLGDFPVRGGISFGDILYVVVHSFLYSVNNAGTSTQIGSISTDSGFVSMASNGLQILIVDGSATGYIYTLATSTLTAITDADYPPLRTCCFVDGYFVGNEINTGKYYISDLYDGLAWNALDFASAESNPDNIERVFEDHGGVMLLGTYTTEIVGDNGGHDFPFSRIGYPIEWGLLAMRSVAKLGDHTCFVGRNRMGESQVILLSGYSPRRVSTPDIESLLSNCASLESATAFAYMQNGHQFYQLNTVDRSYLYDLTYDVWTTVKSYGIARHKANYGFNLANRILVTDYQNGKIYTMRDDVYSDDGDPIIMEIVGNIVFNGFDRLAVHEIQVDCNTGDSYSTTAYGTPTMTDPLWDDVALCLDFDEPAGATYFTCNKTGRVFTTHGSSATTDAGAESGYNSLLMPGATDFLSEYDDTFPPDSRSWTLDCRVKINTSETFAIFDTCLLNRSGGAGARYHGFILYVEAGVPKIFNDASAASFGAALSEGGGLWSYGDFLNIRLTFTHTGSGYGTYNLAVNNTFGTPTGTRTGWSGAQYQGGMNIGVVANDTAYGNPSPMQIRKLRLTFDQVRGTDDYTLTSSAVPYHLQMTTPTSIVENSGQIMLQTSKDFGHTWGTERWQSMGKVGEYAHRVRFTRLGRSFGSTFKLKISDPIKRCIIGVYMRASQ